MRIRRGAALPTAVALCTFLLIISFVVTSIILEISMLNKLTNIETDRNLLFLQAHNLFIEHNGDISTLEDATYTWHTYDGDNNIKALAAYKNNSNEIKFYSIYDFDNEKTSTKNVAHSGDLGRSMGNTGTIPFGVPVHDRRRHLEVDCAQ